MALVNGEQLLELGEQSLGDVGRPSELAKVRNDSLLRFNVAFTLGNVALRHFQGGLMVHGSAVHPK